MKIKCILLLICTFSAIRISSQTFTAGEQLTLAISSYCLIGTNNAPVNLNLSSSVAGAPITSVSNSDVYVKVSSIVPGGTHREITARISSGVVPTAPYSRSSQLLVQRQTAEVHWVSQLSLLLCWMALIKNWST